METMPGPEKRTPQNFILLIGKTFRIELQGVTERGTKQLSFGLNNWGPPFEYTHLSGNGVMQDGRGTKTPLTVSAYAKSPSSLESYKPEFLSDVFSRDDMPDQSQYADAVGQHLTDKAKQQKANGVFTRAHENPVWVEEHTAHLTINLDAYLPSLETYLVEQGMIAEATGHIKLRP